MWLEASIFVNGLALPDRFFPFLFVVPPPQIKNGKKQSGNARLVYKSAWIPLTDKMCKRILREDNERDKYTVNNQLYQHPKGGCTYQLREISRISQFSIMFGTILAFIKFNNFVTRSLNGPRRLFHSICCTTRHIFEPLHVY